MRFVGNVFKAGKFWAIEIPILDIATQGRTKKEAYEMIADAVESLVDKKGFEVRVHGTKGRIFEIGASDQGALTALLLRRMRQRAGLSLEEVAERLGSKSPNSYARYEQGRSVPSVVKFAELFSVVAPNKEFVIMESRARYGRLSARP
ncbi:MAG: helix-turn-helix domain-containing protein [Candidatus Aminicenantes bacterium]|nr:helix-turn-helix domain-containing protein [Candidatus Aminicenantes bacterium]